MKKNSIIDPHYRDLILKKAHKYCDKRGISIGYLGSKIVNDGDFFGRLQDGGDCRASTLVKVDQWLDRGMSC
jgi:hypothetical protein